MRDIECPYCGHEQEVCHDDGQGYAEDETHEMECYQCEKSFVFTTGIILVYSPSKADCMNGGEHTYKPTNTYPKEYTKMYCTQCDDTRKPTDEELAEILATETN